MLENSPSCALSLFSRHKKGLMWATLMAFSLSSAVVILLVKGGPILSAALSPHLVDAGMGPATAEFVVSVGIHVGFATLLLVHFTSIVRANFKGPSHYKGLYRFQMYLWAKEWVEEQQLGDASAETWPETPPTRAAMMTAFGLAVVVLLGGLLLIGAPPVGFVLAIGGHALARRRGIRPVRPLSWHLALTTLLVPVATALLSVFIHVDVTGEWVRIAGDQFLGLFTDSQIPLALLPVYALSLVVTYLIVTYVGMYYLLVAWDSWRVRDRESLPVETSGKSAADEPAASTDQISIEERSVPPRLYWTVAGLILLITVVVPVVADTTIGAVMVIFSSLVLLSMVVIQFGIPSGTLVDGLVGATILALVGGLLVGTASLANVVSGPFVTALFWMGICVGASVGFISRIAMVAERPSSERRT